MEDRRKLALSLAVVFIVNMLIIYMIQSKPHSGAAAFRTEPSIGASFTVL